MPMWLVFLVAVFGGAHARFNGIQDVDSFPKYAVTFLNALPLLANETAESWLHHGVVGGEAEFLQVAPAPSLPRIDAGDDDDSSSAGSSMPQHVEHLRFGPSASYVCLIPPPRPLPQATEELEPAPTPSKTWELLQPLSGKCLYHRQGWFTYSYCHGQHVRQFRELPDQPSVSFPPVAKVPEEDPEYPSYTLGKSVQAEDGSISEAANNLELARGTGQRYLHFRWGDGTICDKTGKRRAIEVQFHCAMSVTDTIVFVKETRTCEYTLVIHTPRLCSEPGFRRVLDEMPAQPIRCREVLPLDGPAPKSVLSDDPAVVDQTQRAPHYESPHPKQYRRRQVTRIPVRAPDAGGGGKDDKVAEAKDSAFRRVLEALLGSKIDVPAMNPKGDDPSTTGATASAEDLLNGALADLPIQNMRHRRLPNGEYVLEFAVDDDSLEDEYDDDLVDELDGDEDWDEASSKERKLTVADALRAAGYDVRTLKEMGKTRKAAGDSQEKEKEKPKARRKPSKKEARDEL